ncbi:uncharacterized protein LOC110697481 isoform X2 [Chenopodium quinoa]|uniref:uncharacterized protein LOC110697481 isoform X1 n=1 Tax=Chenopodium quinoa TaxID=63459 RepID=UPI000B795EDE|nr:uncharacterized protein LOC110697481 isoform X1 [Chenopodium quinoa]XP_021730544.1 uncharacterized protein LOC110697481 isoform X2 [Chenopodium quinoa]
MGNCFTKHNNKCLVEIAPAEDLAGGKPIPPIVFLYGDPSNSATQYLRFALLFKPLSLRFVPRAETPEFTVRFVTDEPVSGPSEMILEYIESKLPRPALFKRVRNGLVEGGWEEEDKTAAFWVVVRMVVLQHKSMKWHLERVVRWGLDLSTRGGVGAVDPSVGTPKMEVSKLGKSYGKLLEVLLEHAQMEERILFPILQASDPGVCRCVTEEHARDLPVMNGIKEDIKSVGVLNVGTSIHREALCSLTARLQTLQENCSQHFNEEEKNLLPLMEAADLTKHRQRKIVEQSISVMQGTHSHLFRFFIDGLLPHEAMEYLDLVMSCTDEETTASMLSVLVD